MNNKAVPYTWSVVMFCRNEAARISQAIEAVEAAFSRTDAHLTIMLNGCSDQTPLIVGQALARAQITSAAFIIPYGCKSNAINQFIFTVRPEAKYYFFVDATAFIAPEVPRLFREAFEGNSELDALSALPLNGRSANAMRSLAKDTPQLFGQSFALTRRFVKQMISLNRRLPVDLYRGDGLLGGYICRETNGVSHEAPVLDRLATIKNTGWRMQSLSPLSWTDMRTAFNRRIRQSRGRLENLSWNSIIWTCGFAGLPDNANDMIKNWLAGNTLPSVGPVESFFRSLAIRQVYSAIKPGADFLKPTPLSA